MRIFVTGFGAFHETTDNPSAKLAESSGCPFEVLRVSYKAVGEFLDRLNANDFDVLLMLGVAGKRHKLTPELFGRNFRSSTADVDGESLEGDIEPGGPVLVSSTLWTPELMGNVLLDARFQESMDAGEYLCNDITYRALRRFPEKRVGFLHVPPETAMPIDDQRDALIKVLQFIQNS